MQKTSIIIGIVVLATLFVVPQVVVFAQSNAQIKYFWQDCFGYSRVSNALIYVPESVGNELSISWFASSNNYNGIPGFFCYQSNFSRIVLTFRDLTKTTEWASLVFTMATGSTTRFYKVCTIWGCFPEEIQPGDLLQACTQTWYWAYGWGQWATPQHCTSWFQG